MKLFITQPFVEVNYFSRHFGAMLLLEQWFPTRGPRAKSGPPSLKMWPAALDKLKKIKELNHRACFLNFQFVLSDFNFRQALCNV